MNDLRLSMAMRRSIAVNEMTSPPWSAPDPASPGQTTGQSGLLSFTFQTDPLWIWAGIGYLLGLMVFCMVIAGASLQAGGCGSWLLLEVNSFPTLLRTYPLPNG